MLEIKVLLHSAVTGEDYGDNRATMHCQLDEGHEGPHSEHFRKQPDDVKAHDARVTWLGDDRDCETCRYPLAGCKCGKDEPQP